MASAVLFLPRSITLLINFEMSLSWYLGSGRILRLLVWPFRDIRFLSVNGLFGPFRSVLGSPLAALVDADRIKGSANDMVTHARQVFDAAAADQNNGVFLQIVAFAG